MQRTCVESASGIHFCFCCVQGLDREKNRDESDKKRVPGLPTLHDAARQRQSAEYRRGDPVHA